MRDRGQRVSRRQIIRMGLAGLLGTTAVGALSSRLQVTRRTLHLPGWRAAGLRVAHVTDIHVINDRLLADAQEAVELAVKAKPDVFVFTGDFLNYDDDATLRRIPKAFAALEGISCPCFAVLGNHDYLSGAPDKVADEVRVTKLRLLVNEAAEVDGTRIVGLDDGNEGSPAFDLVRRDDLVLIHEPDFADSMPQAGLVLSGHSHGGEICLPGGIPLYTPQGSKRYKSGFYKGRRTPVYVNRGTATLTLGRVFCPPEVALLTIEAA